MTQIWIEYPTFLIENQEGKILVYGEAEQPTIMAFSASGLRKYLWPTIDIPARVLYCGNPAALTMAIDSVGGSVTHVSINPTNRLDGSGGTLVTVKALRDTIRALRS